MLTSFIFLQVKKKKSVNLFELKFKVFLKIYL